MDFLNQLEDSNLHWRELDEIFTFCRRRIFNNPKYRYGPLRVLEVVNQVYDHVKEYASIRGASYCEVGCGIYHPFGIAAIMYLNGASAITVIDKRNTDLRRAAEALYDLLTDCNNFSEKWFWNEISYREFQQRLNNFDLGALRNGDLIYGLRNINYEYVVRNILEVGHLQNRIDILSSRAALEHFEFFEDGIRLLHEFMSNGGIAFHLVDLRDHRAYYDTNYNIWSFLTEDGSFADFNCNRLRANEILAGFEKTGCQILEANYRTEHFPEEIRPSLIPKYRDIS